MIGTIALLVAVIVLGSLIASAIIARLRKRLHAALLEQKRVHDSTVQRLTGLLESVARAENEIRFQARLLSTVGQAVLAVDMTGHVVYCNRAAAALFDCEPRAVIGARLMDLLPEVDASRQEATLTRLREGGEWTGELTVRRPDGTSLPIMVTDSPIRDEAGRLIGMVRVAADLRAREQAELEAKVLADASAALAESLDYRETVRAVARLAIPVLADSCVVDVLGEDRRIRRLEAADVSPEREALARELRHQTPITLDTHHPISEVIRTSKPQLIRRMPEDLHSTAALEPDHLEAFQRLGYRSAMILPLVAGGTTFGAISFFLTDSGRTYESKDVELAQELARRAAIAIEHARLYENAMLANRAKSDFLAVMSHELRTPLTTIMGYTDLLLSGLPEPVSPKAHGYIERVRMAAWHLLGVIEQILVFTRVEIGREQAHPERLQVLDLLTEVASLMEPVAGERGLRFTIVPVGVPATIETDLTKIRQILLNLLSNAVKFTESGEVRLGAYAEGQDVVFTVEDTGIGIAAEHLEKVFEPFWQVDQSSTRRVGGTGLGLSVSRRLARLLGGEIMVESEPGKGAVFRVRLPARWTPPEGGGFEAGQTQQVDALRAE